jgi:TolA-binding protein
MFKAGLAPAGRFRPQRRTVTPPGRDDGQSSADRSGPPDWTSTLPASNGSAGPAGGARLPGPAARDTPRLVPGMDEYELEEIKREIVESRSLTIKTNNLVNALAADLKSISKRQQAYARRTFFNSATAYVVTVAIVFIALKFAWDARVETVRAETKDNRVKLEEMREQVSSCQSREDARMRANRAAAEYYALISQNKRRELVEQYDEVSKLPLTRVERAFFEAAVERAKNELSLLAYQAGLDHIRTGRWHEAQGSFRESLKYKNNAVHSPQATYQLARALRALGQQREAIPMLMQLSEASADREVMDEATLLLAEAQLDIQAYNDAKATLRSFIRRFPDSPLINDARLKLADVQLHH